MPASRSASEAGAGSALRPGVRVPAAVIAAHAVLLALAWAPPRPVVVTPPVLQVAMIAEASPPDVPPPARRTPPSAPPPVPVPVPVPVPDAQAPAVAEPLPAPPPAAAEAEAPLPVPEEPVVSLADGTLRVVYPLQSRRLREEGLVVLRIRVEADGRISAAEVLASSGFARLDEAARAAALAGHMRPALRDGVPVAMAFRLPVQFRLVN